MAVSALRLCRDYTIRCEDIEYYPVICIHYSHHHALHVKGSIRSGIGMNQLSLVTIVCLIVFAGLFVLALVVWAIYKLTEGRS